MHGILVVDKPEGLTSAAVVRQVKRALGGKVGHLGTLDPGASGVLPLCLGEGTKIAQFLNTADKSYTGVIRLGTRTDTGDKTGTVVETAPVPDIDAARCAAAAGGFLGERMHTPPMYSAVKKEGVPLYKLARKGVAVERQPRRIHVRRLLLERLDAERLRYELDCSKGTYVRVLAEEIGAALGTCAHVETLRRTRFGGFELAHTVQLPVAPDTARRALISPRQALDGIPEMAVDAHTAERVRRGQVAALRQLGEPPSMPATAKLIGPDGALLAVVVTDALGRWQFARVLTA